MRHPYDAAYLQEISETQGALFERLQDELPSVDGIDFIRVYLKSATRSFLDQGDVYLATIGSRDLLRYYQEEDPHEMKPGEALRGFAPNWMGQFYSQYQWQTGMPSCEVVEEIPPEWLLCAYPGLHDLDLPLAIERVSHPRSRRNMV